MNNSFVYIHRVIPVNLYYVGKSHQLPDVRLQPSQYKHTTLQPYIDEYGWDNIEHIIVLDGLSDNEATYYEDYFIRMYKTLNCCINHRRSGYRWKIDRNKMQKEWNKDYIKTEKYKEISYKKQKKYRDSHKEKIKEYRETHKEELRDYFKHYWSTVEYKIYDRVKQFNRAHQDLKVITPAEAKEMYELTGYIPDFIKKSDLD